MAKLYFYYSAMNAGKSTTLLQSSDNYRERGMNTLLFTPIIDTRFQKGKIHSRIGLESEAISFTKSFQFFDFVKKNQENSPNKLSCILIDEAQFLVKEQVHQLTEIADKLKIPVLAYGIRSDFRAEPFEGSLYLMTWAEELIEIKTICHCGRKATMNLRIDENGLAVQEGQQIHIGGNESYIPCCRVHYKEASEARLRVPELEIS